MDVSIIIPNFNTKKLVLDCVASIKKSRPKSSFEIIVIDNASTDGSVKALKNNFHKDTIVIENKENLGFSKACNLGIKKAGGKYKLILNSDTLVKEGAIDLLLDFAESNPDAGVIGSQLLNKDGSVQDSCFRFPTFIRTIEQFWLGHKNILDKYAPSGENPQVVDAVVGASFLITPKALEKIGFFDERYFMYYEDLDYCRRVWKNGLKVFYLPNSRVIHYHGESGKNIADGQNQWRRLITSSKIYHGLVNHSAITFIIWTTTKLQKIVRFLKGKDWYNVRN